MRLEHVALLLVVQLAACKGKTTTKSESAETTAKAATIDDAGQAVQARAKVAAPAAKISGTDEVAVADRESPPRRGERQVLDGPAKSLLPGLMAQDFAPTYAPKKPPSAAIAEAGALHKRAYALHNAGQLAEAKDLYLQTLRKNPSHIKARYNLATAFVGLGENDKALALLAELERAPKCIDCWLGDHATTDSKWAPLWDSRLFHAVVYEIGADREYESAGDSDDTQNKDLDLIASLCKPGETPDGKLDDYDEGTVYCMKGGKKNGAYYNYETGYDMSEGETNTRGFYKNDKKSGTWSHWESFGASYDGDYRNGKKHGLWKIEGRSEITYEAFVDGQLEGTQWTISSEMEAPAGYVTQRTDYKAGKKEGRYRTWRVDEKLRVLSEAGTYRDDKKSGTWMYYNDETGLPTSLVTFVDGLREGPYSYWSGTKVVASGSITNGSGQWVEYEGDTLVVSGLYKDRKKEGPWMEKEGKGSYAAGLRIGKWSLRRGDDRSEGSFKTGKRTGVWSYYDKDDALIAKGKFVNGKPDGKWTAQVDRDESDLIFKMGRLLRMDDEPFEGADYEYAIDDFSDSGVIYSADEDDEYPY